MENILIAISFFMFFGLKMIQRKNNLVKEESFEDAREKYQKQTIQNQKGMDALDARVLKCMCELEEMIEEYQKQTAVISKTMDELDTQIVKCIAELESKI